MSIRIGISGYGNLGRGIECAIKQNPDMELAAVFTRRDPADVTILTEGVPVCRADEAGAWERQDRRYDSLRRKRYGSSDTDSGVCAHVQCHRQL